MYSKKWTLVFFTDITDAYLLLHCEAPNQEKARALGESLEEQIGLRFAYVEDDHES